MLIKKIFLVFLILFMISINHNIQAKNKWKVDKIQVFGLHRISLIHVLHTIKIHVNQFISQKNIDDSIYALFLTKEFEKIKVFKSNHTIIFQLQERLIISKIDFYGTKIFSLKILKQKLKELGIVQGHSFDLFAIDVFKKQIKNFYQKIGKYQFKIQILYKILPNSCVDLKISLFDGYFYILNELEITGIKHFSLIKIKNLLNTKKKISKWNIIGDKYYYPNNISEDLQKIQNFYFNHGYIHFFVHSIKLPVINNKKMISVFINVHEGYRFNLSDILIHGDLSYYCNKIIRKFHFKHGEPYNLIKINYLKYELLKIFVQNGFNDAKIIIIPEINEDKHDVKIHVNLYTGIRYMIHKIYFKGNQYTKNSILRNIIGISEGDVFRKKDFYHAQQILQQTGFFKNINVDIHTIPNLNNQVDIIFDIKENNTGSFNFSSGYGFETGVNINLNLNQNNWFGSGQLFSINTLNNNYQTYGEIVLDNPYWSNNNKTLTNRIFYDQFKGGYSHFSNYTDTSYGFDSNIGYVLNENNKLQFGIGYVHNGIAYIKSTVLTDYDFFKKHKRWKVKKNVYHITDDFTLNFFLDSFYPFFYNSDWLKNFFNITGKITIPGSDNNFFKLLVENQQSFFLDKQKLFRLLFHSRLGIGDSWISDTKMPFYENFYAGGSHSVRGFAINSIGPKINTYNTNIHSCSKSNKNENCYIYNFIGGNRMLITNLDLFITNLFCKNVNQNKFNTSLFFDLGTVWDTNWKNMLNNNTSNNSLSYKNPNKIHSSVGLSLKWKSSLGEISLSYAEPIGTYNKYKIEKFQFNIGKIS
ncbi:Outer membrane protein assembly factor BamA [Buchnera aphidicola (Eriosoma grossulariae)]